MLNQVKLLHISWMRTVQKFTFMLRIANGTSGNTFQESSLTKIDGRLINLIATLCKLHCLVVSPKGMINFLSNEFVRKLQNK